MAAAAGDLDALVGMSIPTSSLYGITLQSHTSTHSNFPVEATDRILSATVAVTGVPIQPLPILSSVMGIYGTILAVDDQTDTITMGYPGEDPAFGSPFYIIGFSQNALLLSSVTPVAVEIDLNTGLNLDHAIFAVSTTPLGIGTTISFADSGTFSGAFTSNPSPPSGLGVLDTTTGQPVIAMAQPYTGPVSDLQEQYVNITTDNLNITTTTPNWFIHSGSGEDGLAVSSGTNVLDGGTGSNFMTGGTGNDTFYMDDRNPTSPIFSTVANFHSGDNATVWGVNATDFTMLRLDNQGATGFTGLDLIFTAPGHIDTSFVLVGYNSADLTNGRLSMSYGTTPDLPGLPGSQYLTVHAN